MTTVATRRKGRPNDLRDASLRGTSGYIQPRPGLVHDRQAQDLLINARVAAVEIDCPLALNPGDKIVALRSTRNDPLADMRSRGQITECAYTAGRHWQDAYERSQIGSVRAIDPSKEHVDGGRPAEILSDRQQRGANDVHAARLALGPNGNALIHDVLGEGLSIRLVAKKRGLSTERDRRFFGDRLRECLDTLAEVFGYAMVARPMPRGHT